MLDVSKKRKGCYRDLLTGKRYTDFSLNVVNSYTVAFLHSLGVRKITLSYELSDKQIKDIQSSENGFATTTFTDKKANIKIPFYKLLCKQDVSVFKITF